MNKSTRRNVWLQVITGTMIIVLFIWQGRQQRPVELDSGYRQVMGTFARVLVVASDKKSALNAINAAIAVFDRVETLMSDYDPDSQLSEVNRRAFAEPVAVDPELFEVLSAAVKYSALSDGAFDITVGPVVQLWRQAKKTGVAPTPEQVEAARAKVGYRQLLLDPQTQTVRFAVEGMSLDVGGIAKGYAVDKAAAAMRQAGAAGGLVDLGGNLLCFGKPVESKPHWYIGLQDPASDGHILMRLKLDDRAVATSGDYRRFTVLNGQKHSHIIDPATADSAQDLSSVSIIAASAMQADALSTAVSVLGPEKGLALIERLDDIEAILIPAAPPQNIRMTPGASRYIEDAPDN